jgi:hypothetical protein
MESSDVTDQPPAGADDAAGQREFSYGGQIAALGVFLGLMGIGLAGSWSSFYIGGLRNDPWIGFLGFLVLGGLLALVTLVFIFHDLFMLFAKPRSLKHVALKLLFLVIPPIAFVLGFCVFRILPQPAFLLGFEGWVAKNVDTHAIQQWLATEGVNYAGKAYNGGNVPPELPKYLVAFKPPCLSIGAEGEGHWDGTAKFHWGSALAGHWDIVVGPPTMSIPQSGRVDSGAGHVEFHRVIKPGVYLTWSD